MKTFYCLVFLCLIYLMAPLPEVEGRRGRGGSRGRGSRRDPPAVRKKGYQPSAKSRGRGRSQQKAKKSKQGNLDSDPRHHSRDPWEVIERHMPRFPGRGRNDRNRGRASYFGAGHSVFHNPYFHIITSQRDFEWTREHGWQTPDNEDEYHVADVTTTESSPEETTTSEDRNTAWKGEGSFTGDIRLHCLERKTRENCAYGVVQVFHNELEQWGTICGDSWSAGSAQVICNYLNFRNAKPLKLGPNKVPDDVERMPRYIRALQCDGDEWAVTDCTGDQIKRNHTCKTDKLSGVKCTGFLGEEVGEEEEECHKSEMKCQVGDRCIAPEYVCDGMSDCPWGSDEDGCSETNCKKDQYWCGPRGGGCISNEYLCDGDLDCIDDSDERDCEKFLGVFNKTSKSKMRSKKYEVQWEHVTSYLCAQKCKEETSFVCTSFDYNKKSQSCLLFSASTAVRLKRSKKWDHYQRGDMEDCSAARKFRCTDGACIRQDQVCDSRNDCSAGEEEKECEPMKIRLRGGSGEFEGRVEVSKGMRYGLICDLRWTIREANVVCRQLGYSRGAIQALKGGTFERTDRRYVLDNVRCTGRESRLEECRNDGWGKVRCSTDHEAGVVCRTEEPTTPFVTTTPQTSPRIATTTPLTGSSPQPRELCGIKPPDGIVLSPQSRVVGGAGANPHEWPWQAGIWLPWTYWCGGALIHPCWVLTAAHCFAREYRLKDYTLRLGDHVTGVDDGTEQYFKIVQLIKHDYNSTTKDNDIALLKIQTKNGDQCATINNEVSTVCIPKSSSQFAPKTVCHVTGWGKDSATSVRTYVPVLQEAEIPIIANKKCERQSEYERIGNSMFCAGYLSGGIDSCQGDSGGPLSCKDEEDGRYYVWGLVSWGNGCAKPKAPGVYAKVGMFIDWIEEATGLDF